MKTPTYRWCDYSSTRLAAYNKQAVDEAIKRDPRIKPKEAKLIHALLKGRER